MDKIDVSVVIPVRNECRYIAKCIESIIMQDYSKKNMEVIFVDGASEDNTEDIIKSYMSGDLNIRLLKNPKKFVQHALNIGMKSAVGEYIVRMDAHSEYASDYISKCIEYLKKGEAVNVGGPNIARGKGGLQSVIAAAYHSSFALGGAKHHNADYEGFADTVFLGSFRKSDIEKLGYYDERLVRNEDDDLSFTMQEKGMKIFITPKIKSFYYPRDKYKDLFKQYFEYGMWKVPVIKKHGRPARITHLIPMFFVLFIIIFGLGALFSKNIFWLFFGVMGLYFSLNFYFSFKNSMVSSFFDKLRLVLVHFILHFSYGLGFLAGIFRFWNFK